MVYADPTAETPDPTTEILDRITRFVDGTSSESFAHLALDAFRLQAARIEPIRRLCAARGVDPDTLEDWRRIPPVPTSAFKSLELAVAPAREVFRSSGTLGERSVHHHPFPELYRRTIDVSFPHFCWPWEAARVPILSLIPSREQVPDSSLGFMAAHILESLGDTSSRVAFGEAGVDVEAATAWCAERRREGRPGLVLATAFALVQWLEEAEISGNGLRLPDGSVVFETGGFKGRTRELTRAELLELIERRLGTPTERVVREYGMSELTSQLYTRVLAGGDADLFVAPPWCVARVLDPESLEELPRGETGIVALFDLANLGSALHVATQDLGVLEDGGLRLLGRASDAELRGCSLTVEELAFGAPGG